ARAGTGVGRGELTAVGVRTPAAPDSDLHRQTAGSAAVVAPHEPRRFDLAYAVETSAGERIHARALAIATPAYVSAGLLRDDFPELAELCAGIRYTSAATVVLAFARDAVASPLHGSGFVVPRAEGSPILAASWLSSKWPQRAPDDRVLMRTFFGGARDPHA